MKKTILTVLCVALTAGNLLFAQQSGDVHIYIGAADGTRDGNSQHIVVMGNHGEKYTYNGGKLHSLSAGRTGVFALVGSATGVDGHTPGEYKLDWGACTLYQNQYVYKQYPYGDKSTGMISSMCMKVDEQSIPTVVGVVSKTFNKYGYESFMFGDHGHAELFRTQWERKSLKRDHFESKESRVWKVFDCAYYGGKIYATGWGERQYTKGVAPKKYYVRKCVRVWRNGETILSPVDNETSRGEFIYVSGNASNPDIATIGVHRSHAKGWMGEKSVFSSPKEDEWDLDGAAVIKEANGNLKYYFVQAFKLYVQNGDSVMPIEGLFGDMNKVCDIVALDGDLYVLVSNGSTNDMFRVYRLRGNQSTLMAKFEEGYPLFFQQAKLAVWK